MSEVAKTRVQERPVRLTLPASVANDLEGLQRSLSELAGRMGHPMCASGCNPLYLETERDLILDEQHGLRAGPGPWPWDPALGNRLDVFVSESVTYDIELLQRTVAITAERVGHPHCCSGYDIAFRRESEAIAINDRMEVRGFGR